MPEQSLSLGQTLSFGNDLWLLSMSALLFAGLTTLDLVHYAHNLPEIGLKGTADHSDFDVGGPAANAAVTAVALGGSAALATVLGDGPLAKHARAALQAYEVDCLDVASGFDLPVASVWVDGAGERTVLSTDNRAVSVLSIPDSMVGSDTVAVLLDGHYPSLQLSIARQAVSAGVPIVLDCGRWREVFRELLPLASDAILSSGFRVPGTAHLPPEEASVGMAAEYELRLCAITDGSKPVLAATAAGCVKIDVPQVDVVDTLGAGDVLHGAYMFYRYVARMASTEALTAAIAMATMSCTHRGVRN